MIQKKKELKNGMVVLEGDIIIGIPSQKNGTVTQDPLRFGPVVTGLS